jgi:hypothetical protein
MSSRSIAVLLAGTALTVCNSVPAAAIEPDAAAKALAAALVKGSNVEATYDSAEMDGENIVIANFTVARKAENDTVTFEEVLITSPTEGDKGVFQSPEIDFTGGTIAGETSGSIGDAAMTGVTVLDAAETSGGIAETILFETAEANNLQITPKDQSGNITITRLYMESSNLVDGVPQDSKGSVEGITVPPEAFAEAAFKPDAIGYDKVVFDVTWDGSRDLAAKTATIRDFTVSFQDGGDLSIWGVVGDLPDPRALNDPTAAGSVSKTKVHELTIRYDDHSLAGRVLDFLAQQQGLARADYAKQISDALPFLLIAINNPGFQEQVATAVGSFLQDPKSLTIELAPDAPVSGDDLVALAKTDPGKIPDTLNASVTANSPAEE